MHKENCEFEKIISYIEDDRWLRWDDLENTQLLIDKNEIDIFIGYQYSINFNYCPICGKKLK